MFLLQLHYNGQIFADCFPIKFHSPGSNNLAVSLFRAFSSCFPVFSAGKQDKIFSLKERKTHCVMFHEVRITQAVSFSP
jgi:hypothetical protein